MIVNVNGEPTPPLMLRINLVVLVRPDGYHEATAGVMEPGGLVTFVAVSADPRRAAAYALEVLAGALKSDGVVVE